MSLPADNWIKFPMRLDVWWVDGKTQDARTWPKDLETWRTHYTGRLSAVITVIFGKCSSHLTHTVCLSLSLHCGRPGRSSSESTYTICFRKGRSKTVPFSLSLSLSCLLPNIYVLIYMGTHVLYHQTRVCMCVCVLWHILLPWIIKAHCNYIEY